MRGVAFKRKERTSAGALAVVAHHAVATKVLAGGLVARAPRNVAALDVDVTGGELVSKPVAVHLHKVVPTLAIVWHGRVGHLGRRWCQWRRRR